MSFFRKDFGTDCTDATCQACRLSFCRNTQPLFSFMVAFGISIVAAVHDCPNPDAIGGRKSFWGIGFAMKRHLVV